VNYTQTRLPLDHDAPLMQAIRDAVERSRGEDMRHIVAEFTAAGIPVCQPRPRATIVKSGKTGKQHIQVTTAQRQHPLHQWTACIYAAAQAHKPAEMLRCPVGVGLVFHLRAPVTKIGKTRAAPGVEAGTPYLKARWPIGGRVDVDNLAKPVLDVLTNLGWWADDGYIVELRVMKVYAEPDAPSRVDVTVWEVR